MCNLRKFGQQIISLSNLFHYQYLPNLDFVGLLRSFSLLLSISGNSYRRFVISYILFDIG